MARALEATEEGASFVASSSAVDRMGDVIEQKWRLGNYRRNPVILHEHRAPVVGRGKVKHLGEGDARILQLDVKWDIGEHNPVASLVAIQHARGFRSGVSVGFRVDPKDTVSRLDLADDDPRKVAGDVPRWRAGYVYRRPELLEVSSVAVPANPDALQLRSWYGDSDDGEEAAEAIVADPEQLRAYLEELAPEVVAGWIVDAVRASDAVRVAVRSCLLDDSSGACAPPDFLTSLGIKR